MALSTVSGILTRSGWADSVGLGLEPAERYERERPGELVHIDVKKLGRSQGGATQLAYAEVLPDETALTAIAFLRRAGVL